jgi:cyclic pyranopterin phosphate synthase
MQAVRQAPWSAASQGIWTRLQLPAVSAAGLLRHGGQRHLRTEATATLPSASSSSLSEPPQPTAALSDRRARVREAKPFSDFLTDTYNRQHDYLRISVTERCNLRCLYCMPEEGVPLSPSRDLLTTPEIVLLSSVFVSQGVTKIRLTGGEPTVRSDILPLMHQIGALRSRGLRELCITTNGLSLHRKLDSMVDAGLTGVNLSLDTLDPWQFQVMTRRKGFDAVQRSIDRILELNRRGAGIKLKINCVVMRGLNDREVLPFVELTREKDLEVRFIEYMPFDGNRWSKGKMMSYQEMLDVIRAEHPSLQKVQDHANDTSKTWRVPGFAGRIGFITSMTHNFCGTCNRLRITGDGNLKVCLFGNAEVSLRDILRRSNSGDPIDERALEAMKQIEMDRRRALAAGEQPQGPLGITPNEVELLDVIGAAVKRKKEKHAGIGELEHMKNRPMILIGG